MSTLNSKLLPSPPRLCGKTELQLKTAVRAELQPWQHLAVEAVGTLGWGTSPPHARAAPG